MMDTSLSGQQENAERAGVEPILSAQRLYQHDPLFVLLKDKLRLNTLWIIAGSSVLPGVLYLVWWFTMRDVVIKNRPFWELNTTLGALVQTFIVFPLIFTIYLLLPATIADLFNTLRANGVIGEWRKDRPDTETYEGFLQKLVSWTDKDWWAAGALTVIVVYCLCRIVLIEPGLKTAVPVWLRIASIVIFSSLMYMTFVSVMRFLSAFVFTNWLFEVFTIRVKPLDLDGSGGLGVLRRILWFGVVIMLWDALLLGGAVLLGSTGLFSPLELTLLGAIYVVLAPSLLIGWLLLPHRVMVKARDEALRPLTEQFQQALIETTPLPGDEAEVVRVGTDRLSELKRRYDLMGSIYPTWPLDVQDMRRLVAALSLPALLPVIPPLISFVAQTFGH